MVCVNLRGKEELQQAPGYLRDFLGKVEEFQGLRELAEEMELGFDRDGG